MEKEAATFDTVIFYRKIVENERPVRKDGENGRKRRKMEIAHVLSYSGAERENPLSNGAGNDGKAEKKSTLNKRIARFF